MHWEDDLMRWISDFSCWVAVEKWWARRERDLGEKQRMEERHLRDGFERYRTDLIWS